VGTGTKKDESNTGRVWAAGFHHFTVPSRLARFFETYETFISLIFHFFAAVYLGYGVHLYLDYFSESLLSNSQVVPHNAIRSLRPISMPLPDHCALNNGSYIIWSFVTVVK